MLDAHYRGDIDISNYWAIGDSRTISLSAWSYTGIDHPAQDLEFIIVGINHDDLETKIGNISKAAITIESKDCLSITDYISSSKYNTDYTSSEFGTLRKYLNNQFLNNAIPKDISALIKSIKKTTNCINYSTDNDNGINYYRVSPIDTSEYIFIPSVCEVNGDFKLKLTDKDQMQAGNTFTVDGYQYEYYKSKSNRVKSNGTINRVLWWTRTGYMNQGDNIYYYFYGFNGSGDETLVHASDRNYVTPAFCL